MGVGCNSSGSSFLPSLISMASSRIPYENLTIAELKKECQKRGAKTSGRKTELVERLEAYDRNKNFGAAPQNKEYFMCTPDRCSYRDVNSDTVVPKLTIGIVSNYLEVKQEHHELYSERYMNFIRHTKHSNILYIYAQIRASMKASCAYYVDLSVGQDGQILESQCECAVGMGPNAFCKHIAVALLGLVDFVDHGEIKTHQTCTQQLQNFHATKPSAGSPIKACNLKLKNTKTIPDPRPAAKRQDPQYCRSLRNLMVGSKGINTCPLGQLFGPANLEGYVNDHTYSRTSTEESFLEAHGLLQMSIQERETLQAITIKQNLSAEWRVARQMRLTASNFKTICRALDKDKIAQDLLKCRDLSHIPAVRHGRQKEAVAVKEFERLSGLQTQPCGLFVHEEWPFLAASPDRTVIVDGHVHVVEVKCPYVARDSLINSKIPYLIEDSQDNLSLKRSHDYFYQIQGQMACTGFKKCIFIVHTNLETKFFFVNRDDLFIENMVKDLKDFFQNHFRRAVLAKFMYKV